MHIETTQDATQTIHSVRLCGNEVATIRVDRVAGKIYTASIAACTAATGGYTEVCISNSSWQFEPGTGQDETELLLISPMRAVLDDVRLYMYHVATPPPPLREAVTAWLRCREHWSGHRTVDKETFLAELDELISDIPF